MRRYFKVVALPVLLLAGCNLSKFPIDDPAVVKIDARLLGTWKEQEEKKKAESELYTFAKLDDTHYTLIAKEQGKKKIEKYTAFLSEINNVPFLNVHYKDDSTDGYFFIKILAINATGDKFMASPVSDSTMQLLTSSAMVRARIKGNVDQPAFYIDTLHFSKVK